MAAALLSRKAVLSRALVILGLGVAAAATAHGLARTLADRVPLRVVLGPVLWAVEAGLVAGILFEVVALAHEIRALGGGEPRSRPLAPLRAMFVVLALAWLFLLARVQPFERLWFEMTVGVALGAWAGLIAFEAPIARLPAPMRRVCDVLLFSLCAAAVLLEVSLRAIARLHPSAIFARAGDPVSQVREQARMQPGRMRFGFPCNQGGHFDSPFYRKAPGEKLAITIGDSFSLGAVPHAFHFTTVCESKLGCPVYNMGIAGVGPPEYERMLVDEALALDPDVVVIDVFVGNDLVFPFRTRQSLHARVQTWFDRGDVLLWVVPQRLARIAREKRLRAAAGLGVADVQGADAAVDETRTVEERYPWVLDPKLEKPTFSEQAFLDIETDRALEVCRLKPASLLPLEETILEMKRSAGSIRFVVMLIPDEFQVEDDLWSTLVKPAGREDLERDRAQSLVVPWLERNGIRCLDLLPILRAVPPMEDGRRHLYHLRDTHFNARGNRVAGEGLADFLRGFLR
jgi:hypothetical protein